MDLGWSQLFRDNGTFGTPVADKFRHSFLRTPLRKVQVDSLDKALERFRGVKSFQVPILITTTMILLQLTRLFKNSNLSHVLHPDFSYLSKSKGFILKSLISNHKSYIIQVNLLVNVLDGKTSPKSLPPGSPTAPSLWLAVLPAALASVA